MGKWPWKWHGRVIAYAYSNMQMRNNDKCMSFSSRRGPPVLGDTVRSLGTSVPM